MQLPGRYGSRGTCKLECLLNKLNELVVPLTKIQEAVLQLIASQRDAESYVAGSSPLNRHEARFSGDIDIFHDRESRISQAAEVDAAILVANGFEVEWSRRDPSIYSGTATQGGESTRLDWVVDSDFRFFPTTPDKTFGYILHPVDLATNKIQAAAGRRELRDIVDVVTIHERVLPLGAVVWAAVEKMPGLTPEGLIAEIRRNSNYPAVDWKRLFAVEPLDPLVVMPKLRAALDEADSFVQQMPSSHVGLLFLEDNKIVQPDPVRLDQYQTHTGQRRGHWPSSADIESAMLEHYKILRDA